MSLIYSISFKSFPSLVTLEDCSREIVKYVNPTMICFLYTVIQHFLSNVKDSVIALSEVKKLPFTEVFEDKSCLVW